MPVLKEQTVGLFATAFRKRHEVEFGIQIGVEEYDLRDYGSESPGWSSVMIWYS